MEPFYDPAVERRLDEIEKDPERSDLWDRIVDRLYLICDSPEDRQARQFRMSHPNGSTIWRVKVPGGREPQDWCIIWEPRVTNALIHYVGPWPPAEAQ